MTIRRSKIIEVLENLKEEKGYEFETNFWCCSSCASAAMADKYGEDTEKYVFWHEQDDEAFSGNLLKRKMYISWGGNGEEIVEAFKDAGIKTEWEGTKRHCIGILPERTKPTTKTTKERAIEQLRQIRDSGKFNMILSRGRIMNYANNNKMFSLVSYCGNSREKYMEVLKQI